MIRIGVAGTLTATHFDTKSCCDHVVTGGAEYTGGTSPSNVAVAADDTSWVFFGDRAVVLALLDANPPHTHTHTHSLPLGLHHANSECIWGIKPQKKKLQRQRGRDEGFFI